jgi:hypothetical protein
VTGTAHPDVVIAGMPRAGTTFLYHNLGRHPGIHVPWRKELNFLNLHRERGQEWYAAQLAGATEGQLVVDVEPGYFLVPDMPTRLAAATPGVKVVLGVREPVSWARSLHAHFARLGDPVPPLEDLVRDGWVRHQDGGVLDYRLDARTIIARIDGWRREFGHDLLLFDHDHLARDSLAVLRAIEAFLDLPPFFEPGNFLDRPLNASSGRLPNAVARLARDGRAARWLESGPGRWFAAQVRPWFDRWSIARPTAAPGSSCEVPEPVKRRLAEASDHHAMIFATGPFVAGDGAAALVEAGS